MANVWFSGIQEVISKGMLTKASVNLPMEPGKSGYTFGNTTSTAGPTQTSSIPTSSPSPFKSAGTRVLGSSPFVKGLGLLFAAFML
jgi:hypothetical protein